LIHCQAVLAYREAHGPFARLEDLQAVSGFDSQTLDEIKDRVTVSLPGAAEEPSPVETAAEAPAGDTQDQVDDINHFDQARNA
jgi:hypothetical protein